MPPPNAPSYGSGPLNYANQGGADPFGSFDNRIRYNDMVRHQMVAQYQQSIVSPATMTLSQQRQVATQQRFQYGVTGGQDIRHYQRQAELNRVAGASGFAKGAVGFAAWTAADAAVGMTGASAIAGSALGGGILGGAAGLATTFAAPLALGMATAHYVNKGIDQTFERQRFMHSTAADISQYRDRLGFNSLSYNDATRLGSSLGRSMNAPGQFFSKEQQTRIHKIGLSNDLISARGKGMSAGSIRQYEQNFSELKDTTEEVVKLLQTTIEGGMSVIKELQGKGFTSMKQIKQQVMQAKAFGGFTGMGAQNMMALGAAGAQAVQGTPFGATQGAAQYQLGAVNASSLAQSGGSAAYAVKRVGGVAAAGAAIANFQMNMAQTGMGTKLAAYAMNADGTVNQKRFDTLISGNASAYDIVTGANQTGYAMGQGGRAMFALHKEDFYNSLNERQRAGLVQQNFKAWRGGKAGNLKQQAWAFAGLGTNDQRQQRVVMEQLTGNSGYATADAYGAATQMGLNRVVNTNDAGVLDLMIGNEIRNVKRIGKGLAYTGERIGYGAISIGEDIGKAWSSLGSGIGRLGDAAIGGYGWGGASRAKYGDLGDAAKTMYGLGVSGGSRGKRALQAMSVEETKSLYATPVKGLISSDAIKNMSGDSVAYSMQALLSASTTGGNAALDSNLKEALGLSGSKHLKQLKENPAMYYASFKAAVTDQYKSTSAKWEDAAGAFETYKKQLSSSGAREAQSIVSKAVQETGPVNLNNSILNNYVKAARARNIMGAAEQFGDIAGNINELNKRVESVGRAKLSYADQIAGGIGQYRAFHKFAGAKVGNKDFMSGLRSTGLGILEKAGAIDPATGKIKESWSGFGAEKDITADYLKKYTEEERTLIDKGFLDPDTGVLFNTIGEYSQAVTARDRELSGARGIGAVNQLERSLKTGKMTLSEKGGAAIRSALISGRDVESLSDLTQKDKKSLAAIYTRGDTAVLNEKIKEGELNTFIRSENTQEKYRSTQEKLDRAYSNVDLIAAGGGDKGNTLVYDGGEYTWMSKKAAKTVIGGKDSKAKITDAEDAMEREEKKSGRLQSTRLIETLHETAQGRGVATQVSPPVMNYWNNKWSL